MPADTTTEPTAKQKALMLDLVKSIQATVNQENKIIEQKTTREIKNMPTAPSYTVVVGDNPSDYVFIDDTRTPGDTNSIAMPENKAWRMLKSYNEFSKYLMKHGTPKFISFDFNLGNDKTGHDCAKLLVQHCLAKKEDTLPDYIVHDNLESGRRFIEGYLMNWGTHKKKYKKKYEIKEPQIKEARSR